MKLFIPISQVVLSFRPNVTQSRSYLHRSNRLFRRNMSSTYSNLLSPVKLGSVELRNRVIMSALTRDRSIPTNVPNKVRLPSETS